ncbi:MAG: hypothetical protein KA251_10795, partial [Saprospiraceae bacterium]|nr:hypothetical protein [Saprospiraceae bacterium]
PISTSNDIGLPSQGITLPHGPLQSALVAKFVIPFIDVVPILHAKERHTIVMNKIILFSIIYFY